MTVYHIAAYLSASLVILPIIIGIKNKIFISSIIKPIFYLLFISFVFDMIGILLNQLNINNMFLGYIFTMVEFTLLIFLYKKFFNIRNTLIYSLIGLFILIVIAESFHSGIYQYNSISASIESAVFMLFSLFAFYLILKNMLFERDLLSEPFFYINTAVLTYFAGDLFLFLMGSYLQKHSSKQFPELYLFHSVLHIIYYVLIGFAFIKLRKINLINHISTQ